MYCNECGNYLADEHRFCNNCGAARPVIVPGPKGTRWIPALILLLMATAGCAVYFTSIAG
jgi:hypothetical protein